jgi:hypothetical protein
MYRHMLVKVSNIKFHENKLLVPEVSHVDKRMDRQADMVMHRAHACIFSCERSQLKKKSVADSRQGVVLQRDVWAMG